MPGYRADTATEHRRMSTANSFGLSAIDRACIRHLVGHTLAVVEREFILETLRHYSGNRTRAADLLRISIRSLRDRIRAYRSQGEACRNRGRPFRVIRPCAGLQTSATEARPLAGTENWCRKRDSNPRPPHYECGALPAELPRHAFTRRRPSNTRKT